MLFHSSLRKELGRTFSATLVALTTIVVTVMLIRSLGQASGGRIDPADVMLVMGFTVLSHLGTLLTLSLFVAIMLTLSRMYVQSEVVIWLSAGQGLRSFLKPLYQFAWPVLLLVAVLALGVWPWANAQVTEMRARFEQRGDADRVAAGQFRESAGGTRVFFLEQDSGNTQAGSNVFVSMREGDEESIISARSGRLDASDGERVAVLQDGQQTLFNHADGTARVSEFGTYRVLIGSQAFDAEAAMQRPRNKSSLTLLREPTPRNLGELSWRLGLVLAAFNFVLLALATASGSGRSGRSAGLVVALLGFATYYNLLGVGQSWVNAGRLSAPVMMLALHGGVLALCAATITLRHWNLSPLALLRRRHKGATA